MGIRIFEWVGEYEGLSSAGDEGLKKCCMDGGEDVIGGGDCPVGTEYTVSVEDVDVVVVVVSGNGYSKRVDMENGVPTMSDGEWSVSSERLSRIWEGDLTPFLTSTGVGSSSKGEAGRLISSQLVLLLVGALTAS